MSNFSSSADAIAQIGDGSSIAIGGALFTRLPMALVAEIKRAPVKNLHYIAWSGNIPLEMFLENPEKVSELSFCFSSLDIFGLAPRFRKALETNQLKHHEYSALTLMNACDAAARNQKYSVFKKPTTDAFDTYETLGDGSGLAKVAALKIDFFIVHAQEADRHGNVLIRGTKGLDPSYLGAASKIIVSVEKIVDDFEITQNCIFIPASRDMTIVEAPMGAYPTSCLPHYVTDYRAIKNYVSSNLDEKNLSVTTEREKFVRGAAALTLEQIETYIKENRSEVNPEVTTEDKMISYLSDLYMEGEILSAGAVSPLAQGSYFLAKMEKPSVVIMTTAGGYVDVSERPLLLSIGESLDFRTAKFHWGGDETFHLYYEPGFIDYEVVAVAQVDKSLRTNNLWVNSPSGKRIRLPGQGGMADVSDMHRNFVIYQMSEDNLSMVDEVQIVSAQRTLFTDVIRKAHGLRPGVCLYISNLGVSKLNFETNKLERILDFSQYEVSAHKISLLQTKLDPFGVRFLESAKGEARSELIERLITTEEAIVKRFT
jgi:glutaconate CoA-transferase, subunit A